MMYVEKVRTNRLAPLVSEFLHEETGSTAIEYSLIASSIALAIILAVAHIGEQVLAMFADAAGAFG